MHARQTLAEPDRLGIGTQAVRLGWLRAAAPGAPANGVAALSARAFTSLRRLPSPNTL